MISLCVHALIYFLPTILAAHRGRSIAGILLLNLFIGWTVIGWFALLLWVVLTHLRYRFYRYSVPYWSR